MSVWEVFRLTVVSGHGSEPTLLSSTGKDFWAFPSDTVEEELHRTGAQTEQVQALKGSQVQ